MESSGQSNTVFVLKIVAGQKKKKCPGQFTHNQKNNNFYTSPKICSENGFLAETALPAWFGASRPSETDSLRKTDTIGSFFIENGATGAIFGTKTYFLVSLGAEFQFCDKIVAGLEIKKPPGQFRHNQKNNNFQKTIQY